MGCGQKIWFGLWMPLAQSPRTRCPYVWGMSSTAAKAGTLLAWSTLLLRKDLMGISHNHSSVVYGFALGVTTAWEGSSPSPTDAGGSCH